MKNILATGLLALWIAPPAHPAAPRARTGYTRNVAVVLYEGVELLDFAGPGEVFKAAAQIGAVDGVPAFRVYTVATSKEPLTSQGFVKVLPEFSFADAPRPDVFVIPGGSSRRLLDDPAAMAWVTMATPEAEIAMTVCTGAFVLAKTGIMAGKDVTTHHGALASLAHAVPAARVQAGRRFVDNGSFLTTAGVSAGIDGSLHVVARLLGRQVADRTARYMEYAWSPEATLAGTYATLNPSTNVQGRARQLADETYNLACLLARTGRTTEALDALEAAVKDGFGPRNVLESDDDLAPLRAEPRFASILATFGAKKPAPKS